jgi:plastocyanin
MTPMRRGALTAVAALAGAAPALAGDAKITIDELDFRPARVAVHVGDRVEWFNRDIVDHTATATNGAFDVATPKGRRVARRMTKPGTYSYYCRLHPNMTGVVVVEK